MATMERDLLMKPPLPNLAPTPTPKLTPGMETTATDHTVMATTGTGHTDTATMVRDLPMKLPLLSLAPTPTPKLTPGMDIMATATDHTVMVTTVATEATTGA